MTTTKPAPMPVIALGARFQVIDESSATPRWKTVGEGFASEQNARRIAKELGLSSIWMNDGFGRKLFICK